MTEPSWLRIARQEMWEEEIPGPVDNPRIVEYHAATTLKATSDEVPWCSSFANWCMKQAGIKGSRSAAAISWLHWGRDLGEEPELGCIVVMEHHVGFYVGARDENTVLLLGGNQGNMVKISGYPVASVLSYRWPEGVEV